jgi:hypothetical protein
MRIFTVKNIKKLIYYGETDKFISNLFNRKQYTIYSIRAGLRWKDIDANS